MEISGAVAVVAGGGGLLGSATVRRLAELGAEVVVADLAPGRAAALLLDHPDRVRFERMDLTDDESVAEVVSSANGRGLLRVVIAAAGTGFVRRTLDRQGRLHDLASFREMLDQHALGSFVLLRRAAEAMSGNPANSEAERGVIILTASLAGLEGSAGQIAYASAKAAVAGMTLPAARDLAPIGVRVMTIAPGGMAAPGEMDNEDERISRLLGNVPHPRRFGYPEEYALLATQIIEHPYLNGSVIRLDGAARLGWKY